MGRNTRGVRGISLADDEEVVGMVVFMDGERQVLSISENGYGKRSRLDEYRVQSRGGKGIITMKTIEKTGKLVAVKGVLETDDLMIVTKKGLMIRMHVGDISTLGRNTQGVRVINLKGDDGIADVTRVVVEEDEAALDADVLPTDGEELPSENQDLPKDDGDVSDSGDASANGEAEENGEAPS